jgi:AcrR family transcriptional regulator
MPGSRGTERSPAARAQVSRVSSPLDGGVGVSETLRARMCSAAVALVGEVGYARMTVARVVRLSGSSQETFYKCFEDLDDCLLEAFEDALERIAGTVVPAYQRERKWPAKVRAAVAALLTFAEREPAVSTFVFVGALGAGPKVLACRMQALERLKVAFEHGIDEAGGAGGSVVAKSSPLSELREFSPLSAEGAVNGALGILHTRLLEGSPLARRPLSELAGPLTAMIVLPYVGHVAAERELAPGRSRAPEAFGLGVGDTAASNGADTSTSNGAGALNGAGNSNRVVTFNGRDRSGRVKGILHGREIRIGERASKVLAAIDQLNARGSDPSNREIDDATEIKDPTQVSRLTKQLVHHGLVENIGAARQTGKPYAWRVTADGTELLRELEAQATKVRPRAGTPKRKRARLSPNQRAILETLEDGPRTVREVVVITGLSDQTARNNFAGLERRKKVVRTERDDKIAYELPSKRGAAATGSSSSSDSSRVPAAVGAASNGAGTSSSNGTEALAATSAPNGAAASNGHARSAVTRAMLEALDPQISKREFKILSAIDGLNAGGSSPSNREIGNAAQIYDPTQLSRLMNHLAHLCFVEKTGAAKAYAWRLTGKGTDLLRELEGQTVGGTHPADARA